MHDVDKLANAVANSQNSNEITNSPISLNQKDLDRLGRKRPDVFKNALTEIGFCISVLLSMIMAEFLISGFNVLLPNLINDLSFPVSAKTWPSSVFSLVAGAFLLPFGRLADMYGGYLVFMWGNAWMAIWSLIAGFSRNYLMLVFCRALQGLGAAAFLPSGISLLASTYRPGPRKNIIFSLYGGCSPFGFFAGILVAGLCAQFLYWAWFFWVGCILLFIVCILTYLTVERQIQRDPKVSMDWWGCVTSVPGLILLVYAITDSPHVDGGWASPQVLATFIVGVLFLIAFVYVEGWVASNPLLPRSVFATKYIKTMFTALFLAYGCFGIYLLYASFYIETILKVPPLRAAAWFAPLAVGGMLIALIGGVTLHHISGTLLLILSSLGFLISVLLFTLIPNRPNYWAWIFPAMICATIGIDITYNVTNVFITTSVPKHQQGVAGACINGLIFLGMSFALGWADLAVSMHSSGALEESFKIAFELGIGLAGATILLIVIGVRIPKAESDFTADEKRQLKTTTDHSPPS